MPTQNPTTSTVGVARILATDVDSTSSIGAMATRQHNHQQQQQQEEEEDNATRGQRCKSVIVYQLNRLFLIISYPFALILTIFSILVMTIFCVFPTCLCLSIGACLYYGLVDNPIPLSDLIRYLASPVPDDDNFPPHSRPYAPTRSSLQAKLIIRKVLDIENINIKEEDIDSNEYSRNHSETIIVRSTNKCIRFSGPIVYHENQENATNLSEEKEEDRSGHVSHYQRFDGLQQIGNDGQNHSLSEILAQPDDAEIELVDVVIAACDDDENDLSCQNSQRCILEEGIGERAHVCNNNTELQSMDDGGTASIPLVSAQEEDFPYDEIRAEVQLEKVEKEEEEELFGMGESSRDRGVACDICLLCYELDEEVAWSPNAACTHSFHKDCILDWLIRKPSCPTCRTHYIDPPASSDENV